MIPLAGWIVTPAHTQDEPTAPLQGGNGSPGAVRHGYRVPAAAAVGTQACQHLLCRRRSATFFSCHQTVPFNQRILLLTSSLHASGMWVIPFSRSVLSERRGHSEWGSLDFPDQPLSAIPMFRTGRPVVRPFICTSLRELLLDLPAPGETPNLWGECSGCERTHWWGHTAA